MRLLTNLTRMWLTRSTKPFTFKNEYDETLSYADCDKLGLYVHIPFCRSICPFCPYCKTIYEEKLCEEYIQHLLAEVRMVGGEYLQKTGRKKASIIGSITSGSRKPFAIKPERHL